MPNPYLRKSSRIVFLADRIFQTYQTAASNLGQRWQWEWCKKHAKQQHPHKRGGVWEVLEGPTECKSTCQVTTCHNLTGTSITSWMSLFSESTKFSLAPRKMSRAKLPRSVSPWIVLSPLAPRNCTVQPPGRARPLVATPVGQDTRWAGPRCSEMFPAKLAEVQHYEYHQYTWSVANLTMVFLPRKRSSTASVTPSFTGLKISCPEMMPPLRTNRDQDFKSFKVAL